MVSQVRATFINSHASLIITRLCGVRVRRHNIHVDRWETTEQCGFVDQSSPTAAVGCANHTTMYGTKHLCIEFNASIGIVHDSIMS